MEKLWLNLTRTYSERIFNSVMGTWQFVVTILHTIPELQNNTDFKTVLILHTYTDDFPCDQINQVRFGKYHT